MLEDIAGRQAMGGGVGRSAGEGACLLVGELVEASSSSHGQEVALAPTPAGGVQTARSCHHHPHRLRLLLRVPLGWAEAESVLAQHGLGLAGAPPQRSGSHLEV